MNIYHTIRLASGAVIRVPTSIPTYLRKYVSIDKELEDFKNKIEEQKSND